MLENIEIDPQNLEEPKAMSLNFLFYPSYSHIFTFAIKNGN